MRDTPQLFFCQDTNDAPPLLIEHLYPYVELAIKMVPLSALGSNVTFVPRASKSKPDNAELLPLV